jgi:iron complex outermembrane receptor protein
LVLGSMFSFGTDLIHSKKTFALAGGVIVSVLLASPALAAKGRLSTKDLLNMSLKELTEVEVTSVSKKAEKETEAAAAIFVLTQEDIRRSGATSIPEALRGVPGLTVTQSGARDWTVTARGFNDQFSNKLLVLIDGRTVYLPLFSGVVWDSQDMILEDIDRIEVIRGPGATLWGANAVNGVINIITKDAEDTEGGFASISRGNQVDGIASVRYGGQINEDSYARVYAKRTAYDSQQTLTGANAADSWKKTQAGFRSDSYISDTGSLTVQGDAYQLDANTDILLPDLNAAGYYTPSQGTEARGANILMRWEEELASDSATSLQVYFDHVARKIVFFNDNTNTVDIDFQHVWSRWEGHEIVWGTGYRLVMNENDPASAQYQLTPQSRNDNLFNAFVQDKMPLYEDELFLTLGSKFEHNNYTGVEIQPSARISWLPTDNQTVWASVSRAVHTPSRYTDDARQSLLIVPPGAFPTLLSFEGNRNLDSEELVAYELGYRIQPTSTLSFDVATFYNDYSKLFLGTLGTPALIGGTYILQPVNVTNGTTAYSTGVEMASKWNVSNDWQLGASYSYISMVFDDKSNLGFTVIGKHPKHQFSVRSAYMLPYGIQLTNALFYVDDLTGANVPDYFRLDAGLSYNITDAVELSLIGHNLLDDRHQEFSGFSYQSATEIGRSILAQARVEF